MLVLKSHIVYSGTTRDHIDKNYFTGMGFRDIAVVIWLSIFIFVIVVNLIDLIITYLPRLKPGDIISRQLTGRKWIFVFFFALVLVWGIGYLSFWPGTSMWNDIDAILVHGPVGESFRSPVLYNLIVVFFLEVLCDPLQNPNIGFALFTLFQLLFMSAVVTYVLWWAYSVVKMRTSFVLALFIFYAFYPVIGLYSFTVVKDTPYSLFMFLWIPFLYDLIREKTLCMRNKVLFCFLIVGSLAFRTNGKILVPLLLIAIFILIKNHRKFIAIAGVITFLIVTVSTGLLTRNVPYRFAEGIGLPLQQVAMVLSYDGKISDEDKEFLFKIKEEEYWTGTDEASYSPMIVDPLKMADDPIEINSYVINDDYLNSHRIEFIKTYLHVLKDNPVLCAKAWLMNTYGFWAYGTIANTQAYMDDIYTTYYDYQNVPKLPEKINNLVRLYYSNLSGSTGSAGTWIWLMLFVLLLFIVARKIKYILLLLPILFNWLILMFFTPIAFGFRYVYYYLLIIPLIILLLPTIFEGSSSSIVFQKNMKDDPS